MTLPARAAWSGVVGGLLSQAAAMVLAFAGRDTDPLTSWLAIVGLVATLAGTLMLGAMRRGRLTVWGWLAVGTVLVVLLAGFGAALLLPAETPEGPLWLGLPRRAAIVLFGVGLLPVAVLPLCHALDAVERDRAGRPR